MREIASDSSGGISFARGVLIPSLVAVGAIAVAVLGALLIRGDGEIDDVNLFVESLSGNSASFLSGLGVVAPLGFAFGAGVAAAFNPCGFAMLPAYMGLYLGVGANEERTSFVSQLGRALLVGVSVTAGFVLLFAVAGSIIGLGARSVVGSILPWLGLGIGILLVLAGAWLLRGGELYTALAQQAATRLGNPGSSSVRGYFLFGLSYGVASLSCTLPIFLAVIGSSFAASDIVTSFSQFVLYALGMGVVIIALTLSMALFKGAMLGGMRRVMPYVHPIGTWLMIIAGTYIVFYWLTLGGLLG
ncbi:MAG: cytochrome c biogenesis protein CcdA [Dehalococcoidia bacterium]|nr:cytochrome c biogenesis protein CcdA [Dehalococcoidia bacterium]